MNYIKLPQVPNLSLLGYRKNECSNDHTDKTEIDDDAHHHGGEVPRIRGSDPHHKKSCPHTTWKSKESIYMTQEFLASFASSPFRILIWKDIN